MEAAQIFLSRLLLWLAMLQRRSRQTDIVRIPVPSARIMGSEIVHRTNKYLNNRLEQDHRGIKQRYYPMRGFGTVEASARFCCAFDELRNHLRPRRTMGEGVSLLEQRQAFRKPLAALQTMIQAAS